LGVVGSVITVSVNVPINGQIALWNPSALPEGYEERTARARSELFLVSDRLPVHRVLRKQGAGKAAVFDQGTLEGKFLRVVTLEDKVTIHNAFLDRRFKP
jgi:hypothetical protein